MHYKFARVKSDNVIYFAETEMCQIYTLHYAQRFIYKLIRDSRYIRCVYLRDGQTRYH